MTGPHAAGPPWTSDDDRKLMELTAAGNEIAVIARKLKRTILAVQVRRRKLQRLALQPGDTGRHQCRP